MIHTLQINQLFLSKESMGIIFLWHSGKWNKISKLWRGVERKWLHKKTCHFHSPQRRSRTHFSSHGTFDSCDNLLYSSSWGHTSHQDPDPSCVIIGVVNGWQPKQLANSLNICCFFSVKNGLCYVFFLFVFLTWRVMSSFSCQQRWFLFCLLSWTSSTIKTLLRILVLF